MNQVLVVLCTCPDDVTAETLACGLIEQGFAACVNILPEIRSIYRWHGKVQQDSEVLMIVKTSQAGYPQLEAWLVENHPYDVPEVVALPVEKGAKNYLDWVVQEANLTRG